MNLPNLFIVGAPKCGTTAMHTYLSQHPEIFMSIDKEPSYFHVVGEGENKPQYHRYRGNLQRYLNLFSAATGEKYRGESSPGYLSSPIAPKEIYDFNPGAKIIIMLREPVDLMVSAYYHHKFMGLDKRDSFDEAILEEFNSIDNDNILLPWRYLELCHFSQWTKNYIDQFGRENVYVILYDDLKRDVYKTYRGLLSFLEVNENLIQEFKIINRRKTVRSKLLHNVLGGLHLSPHYLKNSCYFNKLRKLLPFHLDLTLVNIGKKIYAKESYQGAQCSDESVILIRDYFKPEIQNLEKIINRDLSGWL